MHLSIQIKHVHFLTKELQPLSDSSMARYVTVTVHFAIRCEDITTMN